MVGSIVQALLSGTVPGKAAFRLYAGRKEPLEYMPAAYSRAEPFCGSAWG